MRQFCLLTIQPEVRFIAKQNSLMKIGNNGNLVLGPFDECTPCLMIVLMNCQTKLRINHLTAVKSVAILENEILTTVRDLELEVNEDDIEELIMGHEDELTTEELQEILNEEHQETQ
ncbi:hypothetical protein TNCV_3637941 [Trichonephila clavipes]|nr:hypothetical protein TNCV_3637941 [Trichonephila clavipes]